MVRRVPGEGRYAQLEREQRWALLEMPARAERVADIVDRYIVGTRLRLRRVDTGADIVFKLTQKVRVLEPDPERVKLTNIYLSADEHDVVATLPAAELRKSRWQVNWTDRRLAVDQFHGRLAGLLLAEVELSPEEDRLPSPAFAVREVTDDDRFSGGALATASDEAIRALLRELAPPRGGNRQ